MTHINKLLMLFMILPRFEVFSQHSPLCDIIDIKLELYTAAGHCDSQSMIWLSKNGLVCTNYGFKSGVEEKDYKPISLYIPLTKLDLEKLLLIDNYIRKNLIRRKVKPEMGIHDKNGEILRDSFHSIPLKLSFFDEKTKKYWTFRYFSYDKKVERLIWMLNELVPDNNFFIYPSSSGSEPVKIRK